MSHHTPRGRFATLLGMLATAGTVVALAATPANAAPAPSPALEAQQSAQATVAYRQAVELTFTVSTGGTALNVRSCARLSCGVVTTIPNGTFITVDCQRAGDTVTGNLGTSAVWDRIIGSSGPIGFASDTNIRSGYDGFHPGLPRC
ncbi:SH3 domain-containing protein [Micromonospora sp. NPDC092111]|uniref:SH3 domain-containing protein n=1 Tax=Micromonospora sp. NPDC092111 TaxID=3364289 RepID=UPI0038288585